MLRLLEESLRVSLEGKISTDIAQKLIEENIGLLSLERRSLGVIVSEVISASTLVAIKPDKTVIAKDVDSTGSSDPFYRNRKPPKEFIYPEKRTRVVTVCNYENPRLKDEVPAGTYGSAVNTVSDQKDTCNGIIIQFVFTERNSQVTTIPLDCMHALLFFYQ